MFSLGFSFYLWGPSLFFPSPKSSSFNKSHFLQGACSSVLYKESGNAILRTFKDHNWWIKKDWGRVQFPDKGSMERSPMWLDPMRLGGGGGEGREIPAVTDQGKILEGALGDQSEGTWVFVFIILKLHWRTLREKVSRSSLRLKILTLTAAVD